jgi:hypothetical protein
MLSYSTVIPIEKSRDSDEVTLKLSQRDPSTFRSG